MMRSQELSLMAVMVGMAVMVQHGNCKGGYGDFVGRKGNHFTLKGKPHYVNGFNAYWLMFEASDPSSTSKVSATLKEASKYGLNVARTWAFSDGGYRALQITPGSYDQNVFKGLDFVVSEAGKYGIRLILSLVNNWKDFGGKIQYVKWAKERGHNVTNFDDFFTHPIIKQYYKDHIKAVLTRNNTITGVAYKDDPTIFAWELINEPRTVNDSTGKIFQDWVKEMAVYVKSIDGNHLLEVGLEGFYGDTMPERKKFNPGYTVGTDFISNTLIPEIDFATIHMYTEWVRIPGEAAKQDFVKKWMQSHIEDCNNIVKKPVILSEFGMSSTSEGYSVEKRDRYFEKLLDVVYKSASSGGSCGGSLFWQVMGQGVEGLGDGLAVVLEDSPSTAAVLARQSRNLSALASCQLHSSSHLK